MYLQYKGTPPYPLPVSPPGYPDTGWFPEEAAGGGYLWGATNNNLLTAALYRCTPPYIPLYLHPGRNRYPGGVGVVQGHRGTG